MARRPTPQPDLFDAPDGDAPEGFRYQPELINPQTETALAVRLAALPFQPFDFQGHLAHRHVATYGYRYDYDSRRIEEQGPMPGFLAPLRDRAAAFAGLEPKALVQVLINRYASGAGIGWHRDKPQFGVVLGVSLLAPAVLRFRLRTGEAWDRRSIPLEPRSVYLLDGPARWAWEHSISPHSELRYSVTFRTLKG